MWYAECADTRNILAFQIGKRNDAACKKLFKKLAHLEIGKFYTDDWKSYKSTSRRTNTWPPRKRPKD